jgi:hypothetical protein
MKLPGIESADVSLEKASADIRLKPDNRITMPQLRELLKKNGYPTRDARIEARGRIVDRAGARVLDLLNGSTMELDPTSAAVRADDAPAEIVGVSHANGKTAEKLVLEAVRPLKD